MAWMRVGIKDKICCEVARVKEILMNNQIIAIYEDFQRWIDDSANMNTFLGLIAGIVGLALTVFLYKKQNRSTALSAENSIQPELEKTYLGVAIKVDHTSRRMTGYGASEGNVIQAGHFKANYEVEAELTITIQNESPNTIYEVEVSYIPNQYTQKYTLTDTRDNKLQPLEGDKHFEFRLRVMNEYFDKYAQDVDNEFGSRINKVGKGVSLLTGSKICISYKDAKHNEHTFTEVVK